MKRKRIALLYGGSGAEHEVSVMGAHHVLGIIDRKRYIPYPVLISRDGLWYAEGDLSRPVTLTVGGKRGVFTECDTPVPVAAVFPLLHGDMGEDGCVQGLLECASIPYVGCRVGAGALCSDKILTKNVAAALGIPTVCGIELTEKLDTGEALALAESQVGYPMFIKPSGLGSSVGARAVHSREDFSEAYTDAALIGNGRVLIEELIEEPRELECAYLRTHEGEIITDPGEIIVGGVYGYDEKYGADSNVTVSPRASVSERVRNTVKDYALRLVRHTGIRGIARIDFFLSGGRVLFNEINTMPGFTNSSLYHAMIAESGIPKCELITELIEGAMLP